MLVGALGLKAYVKNSFHKWCDEQKITINAGEWKIRGHTTKPQLIFKKVKVQNRFPNASFQKIFIDEITLHFDLFTMLKAYFRTYEVPAQFRGVKIEEKSKSYAGIEKGNFVLVSAYPIYKIKKLEIEMLDIGLSEEYATISDKPDKKSVLPHLVLYSVLGGIEYNTLQRTITLEFRAPAATQQMPVGSTYDLHVNGVLNLLTRVMD